MLCVCESHANSKLVLSKRKPGKKFEIILNFTKSLTHGNGMRTTLQLDREKKQTRQNTKQLMNKFPSIFKSQTIQYTQAYGLDVEPAPVPLPTPNIKIKTKINCHLKLCVISMCVVTYSWHVPIPVRSLFFVAHILQCALCALIYIHDKINTEMRDFVARKS